MSAGGQTYRERWIWGGLHGTSDDRPSSGPNQFACRPPRSGPSPHSGATPVKSPCSTPHPTPLFVIHFPRLTPRHLTRHHPTLLCRHPQSSIRIPPPSRPSHFVCERRDIKRHRSADDSRPRDDCLNLRSNRRIRWTVADEPSTPPSSRSQNDHFCHPHRRHIRQWVVGVPFSPQKNPRRASSQKETTAISRTTDMSVPSLISFVISPIALATRSTENTFAPFRCGQMLNRRTKSVFTYLHHTFVVRPHVMHLNMHVDESRASCITQQFTRVGAVRGQRGPVNRRRAIDAKGFARFLTACLPTFAIDCMMGQKNMLTHIVMQTNNLWEQVSN